MGDEIEAGEDELSEWAAARGAAFLLKPDPQILSALSRVSAWTTAQSYDPAAVSTFLQVADYYPELDDEFRLARVLIETRSRAGLSQAELAVRMKTSQSYIARIEGGRVRPSTAVLERLAKATGTRLQITFVPQRRGAPKARKAS